MIELKNEHISLQILPELGGKISSLIDQQSGREWLWTHPSAKRRLPVYGESFVEELDTGGWDEIFPSVAPCILKDGTVIPDHGDLVFLPAELSDQSTDSLTLITQTRAITTRFTRRLRLEKRTLQIDYSLESLTDKTIPYLWATHPLIALEDGMALEIPTTEFTSTDGLALEQHRGRSIIRIDDPAVRGTPPHMLKFFTARGSTSYFTLRATDQSSLRMDWNPEENPFLGLWLNQRNWSGIGNVPYFNLGVEPTTSPHDSLADAIAAGDHHTLDAFTTKRWSIRLTLG